ncbi:MAG: hypothetical protein ACLTQG_30690 [Hungatella sp.]|uniref:hypothetical protein n=1 Tax=Hungatella sp. TaxID=2613924 RepID=UPI003994D208
MNYEAPVYVCGGGDIFLSRRGHSSIGMQFEQFEEEKQIAMLLSRAGYYGLCAEQNKMCCSQI